MSVSALELKELTDETRKVHKTLMDRVEESDKERKAAHEELTSKTAQMFGEATLTIERINTALNELQTKYDELDRQRKEEQLAANRPPFHGLDFAGKKQRSDAHKAWMKAIKTRDNGLHLTSEEKSLIIPAYMPQERKALYAADATTGKHTCPID